MHCPDCGMGYVPEVPSNRRAHRAYHDTFVYGLKLRAVGRLPVVWGSSPQSIRVVTSRSPIADRRVAHKLTELAADDVEFSFVTWHAKEPPEDRDPHLYIGVDADRAVGYVMLERRQRVWPCSWEDYDQHRSLESLAISGGVWSLSMAWVTRRNRRRGWATRIIDVAAHHLGVPMDGLAWYTPFSPDGEAFARRLYPDRFLIGK